MTDIKLKRSLVFCSGEILSFSNFPNSTNFTLNSFNGSTRTKTKGTVNYFIAMNAQPAQQQGEIKFHNYLVCFIIFDTMNAKKGGKNEIFITSIILGGNCFDSIFVADVVFRTRN